eukprot:EG_transcript_24666
MSLIAWDALGPLAAVCKKWGQVVILQRRSRLTALFGLWQELQSMHSGPFGRDANLIFGTPAVSTAATGGAPDPSLKHLSHELESLHCPAWWACARARLLDSGAGWYARYKFMVLTNPHTSRLTISVPMEELYAPVVEQAAADPPGCNDNTHADCGDLPDSGGSGAAGPREARCGGLPPGAHVVFQLDIQRGTDASQMLRRQHDICQAIMTCVHAQLQELIPTS